MALEGVGTDIIAVVTVLIGIVAFFYSNLGLGGGQLYVPIMDFFLPDTYSMKDIVPLSLMFAFVTMITATYTHTKKKLVNFKLGIPLALAGLIGVAAGVTFTSTVEETIVKAGFALLLIIVATKMLYDIYRAKAENKISPEAFSRKQWLAGIGVSVLTGFFIGSFGIGGGVVSVPLIIYAFRVEARKAIGTSALMGAILTPAAFLAYVLTTTGDGSEIPYGLGLILTPIVFVMAFVGSTWGLKKLRTPIVKTIFTCGVYIAASEMIYSLLYT
ncbi:MAG: sulfite exporter TauE/SafE family protein [Thermoplasmata archaeon]|jgi:hypothetical protein|nr:sulfite exporter TauE/SafE family protein [Thermoplasmata archaeon]